MLLMDSDHASPYCIAFSNSSYSAHCSALVITVPVCMTGHDLKLIAEQILTAGAVCRFDPATCDINELKRLLTFSTKFVNSLHLQQLPSHLDLQIIFDAMRRCAASILLNHVPSFLQDHAKALKHSTSIASLC